MADAPFGNKANRDVRLKKTPSEYAVLAGRLFDVELKPLEDFPADAEAAGIAQVGVARRGVARDEPLVFLLHPAGEKVLRPGRSGEALGRRHTGVGEDFSRLAEPSRRHDHVGVEEEQDVLSGLPRGLVSSVCLVSPMHGDNTGRVQGRKRSGCSIVCDEDLVSWRDLPRDSGDDVPNAGIVLHGNDDGERHAGRVSSRQTISYAPMPTTTVLYLHGFASSPAGRKVTLLRELLEPRGFRLVAPDLNVPSFEHLDFEAMVARALEEAASEPPAAIVGSSLGALVALAAARRGLTAPLLLLAPALGFGDRWTKTLPPEVAPQFFHHGFGEERPIHRKFFESMEKLGVDREPPQARVTVIMGRKDASVPFELVEGVWCAWVASGKMAAGARFVEIPEGDHGLVDFVGQIAGEIEVLIGDPAPLG